MALHAEPATAHSASGHSASGHSASGHSATEFRFRESASGSADRMQQIQQRLQLMGARYMVLETWGDVSPRYRFYCRMPQRDGGQHEHEHEAICGDPVEAMQRVLAEVEQQMANLPRSGSRQGLR